MSNLRSTKPPEDVISELKSYAEATNTPMDEIKSKFYDILEQGYLSSLEITERCRQASKILLAQLAEKYAYSSGTFEFKVFDKTSVREFEKEEEQEDPQTGQLVKVKVKSYMAKIYGIFAGTGEVAAEYPTKLGILTLWGDAAQCVTQVVPDGIYTGEFGLKAYENKYELTLNEPINFGQGSAVIPPMKDIITQFMTPIPVSLVPQNLSEDRGDYRLIKGRVRSSRISLSKKGKNMGWLDLIDETASLQDIKTAGNNNPYKLSVIFFDAPEFATRYTTGSLVYVLAETSQGERGTSAFGQLVIPIVGIPGKTAPGYNQSAPTNTGQAQVPPKAPVQQPPIPSTGNQAPAQASVPPATGAPVPPTNETKNPTAEPAGTPAPEEMTGW